MAFDRFPRWRSRWEQTTRALLALAACACWSLCAGTATAQVLAGSSIYVRTDSDRTTVIAPRLHVGAPIADATRVDVVYTADVWTSASIDIRTSASKPVTEQRDEIDTTLTQEWNDFSLSGTYRYSHEYDYLSHGGTLTGSYSFAEKSATLDFRLAATFDEAGRAGFPDFDRNVTNLGARVGFTQLLDAQTFVQVIYELMSAHGFNSSAYRFIGIGSSNGLCGPETVYCIPENSPNERLRHAVAASFRRALSEKFSVGAGYRFYLDSWDVMSHTGLAELNYMPSPLLMFSVRYRFYLQGAAKHYRRVFDSSDINLQYYTNDKELSAFSSHRLALDVEKTFELDDRGHQLGVVVSVAPSIFMYQNYAPLKQIEAFEATLSTVFKL